MVAAFGPLLCCLLILIWWLSASRATWKERVFGFIGIAGSVAVMVLLIHPTMRGPAITYVMVPMGFLTFAVSLIVLAKRRPVVRTGTVVYGRADMPDDFAYAVAKALDEQQQLFQWSQLNFSYNVHTVWKAKEVPLHPGAEKYYREVGLLK